MLGILAASDRYDSTLGGKGRAGDPVARFEYKPHAERLSCNGVTCIFGKHQTHTVNASPDNRSRRKVERCVHTSPHVYLRACAHVIPQLVGGLLRLPRPGEVMKTQSKTYSSTRTPRFSAKASPERLSVLFVCGWIPETIFTPSARPCHSTRRVLSMSAKP